MITTRRALLQGGAALAACAMLPASPILAATQTGKSPLPLRAVKRTLEVKGRAATVLGLEGPSGPGLTLDAGQRFQVNQTNGLDEPTLIHWHHMPHLVTGMMTELQLRARAARGRGGGREREGEGEGHPLPQNFAIAKLHSRGGNGEEAEQH
ncbi:multicopper oxidase domain-containing protein [Pannonibacter indicus]|uniref:Multicopper oxidase n=1 Tax=Pannonibacter indicus TaxID=466044 RepID=A0A0K6I737_9HYPH|nr:multicopper oxidase domain-containing protein [Pannonibacter indicus]CUA99092.1 Multicopper oxidase [Pannonibacter indicus]